MNELSMQLEDSANIYKCGLNQNVNLLMRFSQVGSRNKFNELVNLNYSL